MAEDAPATRAEDEAAVAAMSRQELEECHLEVLAYARELRAAARVRASSRLGYLTYPIDGICKVTRAGRRRLASTGRASLRPGARHL